MAIETMQRLTAIPYIGSTADNLLAELASTMARLTRDVPELAEATRQIVLARRCLRRGLLLADDLASDAI